MLIRGTFAYLALLLSAAFAGRVIGMITVTHGVRIVRRIGYRGRHRP